MKKIKINESNLNRIIKQTVKKLLSEGALTQKDIENLRSWDELRNQYYNSNHTYYRPIGKFDNGYQREYIQPDEELDMYKSMGNPSQYATKGEFEKNMPNQNGGWHKTPLRYDDGNLSIAAQSEPMTSREIYGDDDDTEVNVRYKDSEGNNKLGTTASYARNPRNFMGNQDMHDLESDRIAQANADAEAEGQYMRDIAGVNEVIQKIVKKHVNEALNELDWRTYQSAYEKDNNQSRKNKFRQAANNAFNRQNGYGLQNVPYGYTDDDNIAAKGDYYGGQNTYRPMYGDTFDTVSSNNQDIQRTYNQQHINTTNWNGSPEKRGKNRINTEDGETINNATTFNPRLKMAQMKGDKQVRDYFQGKSKYKNGKWR